MRVFIGGVVGEILALLTALFWAVGVIFFKKSGEHVGPFELNLFKNVLALACLLLTIVVLGIGVFPDIPKSHLVTLLVSGMLGIGISDILFLKMLNMLGASRSALIDCSYSPMVIIGGFAMFGERLSGLQLIGGLLILASIFLSSEKKFDFEISRRTFVIGALCGFFSMFFVALALLMVKPILSLYSIFWISSIRMAAGIIFLLVLAPFHPRRKELFSIFRPQRSWRVVVPGSFIASYLSLLAWLAGYRYAKSGVVALLNQMSTVLIVLLAALFLHEKMTRLKMTALLMAVAGAVMVVV